MKSYTDIEQSRKLAEILPLETADMRYGYIAPYDFNDRMYDGGYDDIPYPKDFLKKNPNFSENEYDGEFPCWSLAALLEIIRVACRGEVQMCKEGYFLLSKEFATTYHSNPIDAVYEMILKLNKRYLL